MLDELTELRSSIEKLETPARFRHTLGVEKEVAALGARLIPGSVNKLRIAALLHDVTKEWSPEEQIRVCRAEGIPLTDELIASPQVLHGLTAVKWIQQNLPAYADAEVLHAISVHTTGDADMSVFDEILFVADYTEEGRVYPACQAMRQKLWSGMGQTDCPKEFLAETVYAVLGDTVAYLNRKQKPIVSQTLVAYRAYEAKIARQKG